jgi:hypothetical protein
MYFEWIANIILMTRNKKSNDYHVFDCIRALNLTSMF